MPSLDARSSVRAPWLVALALAGCSLEAPEFFTYGLPCEENLDCATDAPVCVNGRCVTREPSGLGGPCLSVLECRTGAPFCVDGACATCDPQFGPCGDDRPEGSLCAETADCAEGLFCGINPECLQQSCSLEELATRPPLKCQTAGEAAVGDACAGPADCQAGLVCGRTGFALLCQEPGPKGIDETCAGQSECRAGLNCHQGLCAAGIFPPDLFPGVTCPPLPEGPSRFVFRLPADDRDFFTLPFPNDIRRGGADVRLQGLAEPELSQLGGDVLQHYLAELGRGVGGFDPHQAVLFRHTGDVDFSGDSGSFRLLDNVYFVDLTPGPDFGGKTGSLSFFGYSGAGKFICEQWIGLHPQWGAGFQPGHTYGAVIERSVKNTAGEPLRQDTDFTSMLAAEAPSDAAARAAWEAYAPLRAWLGTEGAPQADGLAVAAVFTVAPRGTRVERIREAVQAAPAQLTSAIRCDEGVASPCAGLAGAEQEGARACVREGGRFIELHARLSLPIVQQGTPPYLEPKDGGAVQDDGNAVAIVRREEVCASITVPKGDAPEAGFPVVLYAHGTGGHFRSQVTDGLADALSEHTLGETTARFVTVGFDQVQHADRRNSDLDPEVLFYNFANVAAARGNVYQGAADLLALSAWLAGAGTLEAAGVSIPIDESRLWVLGHSQGATTGGLSVPVDPHVRGVIYSGGGGGLTLSLLAKTKPIDIAATVRQVLMEPFDPNDFHPLLNLLQMAFGEVDPLNYARALTQEPIEGIDPKHVLFVVGLSDGFTPNATAAALIRRAGLPVARPNLLDPNGGAVDGPITANRTFGEVQRTQVAAQYLPGDYDGHFVLFRNEEARRDLLDFLLTDLRDGTPTFGTR